MIAAGVAVGLCGECFRAHLFGKFKLAVTSNAMVRPTDSVLLAFSGAPASSFKTQQLLDRPLNGINNLVASFIERLREENPSREHTIVRTAQKLKPFSFNKFSADGYHDFLPSRLRPKFQNVDNDESTFSEILCLICGSPFSESELPILESTKHKAPKKTDLYTAHCCQSCHFQILPNGGNLHEHFFSLLPKFWTGKVDTVSASHSLLRDQIEEYLLEDNDDSKFETELDI
ncbi:hypothetical protein GUJ93_ZPchr0009g1982 [Zizania palustris]|uniref:Cytoplasmic tRNA 2-thiolation protein 2 n=1 Tax=Zizania palustris TaxID=103762 RepID=A0A8J5S3L4_ZIZPA|nr:hypothetical protein GUJ93_ZPchr0009g1982 [Zizania palustris]